jgi:hypothetical protein
MCSGRQPAPIGMVRRAARVQPDGLGEVLKRRAALSPLLSCNSCIIVTAARQATRLSNLTLSLLHVFNAAKAQQWHSLTCLLPVRRIHRLPTRVRYQVSPAVHPRSHLLLQSHVRCIATAAALLGGCLCRGTGPSKRSQLPCPSSRLSLARLKHNSASPSSAHALRYLPLACTSSAVSSLPTRLVRLLS